VLWTILAVTGVLVVVGTGFFLGKRAGGGNNPADTKPYTGDEKVVVTFLAFPSGDDLEMEAREITHGKSRLSLGQEIIRNLIKGPEREALEAVASPEAELRAFYIDSEGIAYIDMDRQALNIPKDALGEYMAIQSFFESLRRNIKGIKGIKFLIDSNEVDSLWGHFDATSPWTREYRKP